MTAKFPGGRRASSFVLLAIVCIGAIGGSSAEGEEKPQAIHIARVQFQSADIHEAIAFLEIKTKAADPLHRPFNIAVAAPLAGLPQITLALTDATVEQIVQVIAGQLELKAQLAPTVLMLVPKGATVPESAAPSSVRDQAQRILLPRVNFREASVSEAIDFLKTKSKSLEPAHADFNIALAAPVESLPKVTLDVTEASLYDVLQVVAGQAKLKIQLTDKVIMLVPKDADKG